ncbi:MAG: DNA-binding response regulator [Parapedobacter sp.]|nr:MAG: DNA-binding response regulator [Parapedobacter sp.]
MRKQLVLIVDYDDCARQKLRELIHQQAHPVVHWECSNGREAIRYINALQPDLVFMNVALPGKGGFEVLDVVEHLPAVIFVSDTPAYAAKAFDYHAIDYLIKPLDSRRLLAAWHRFEQQGASLSPRVPPSPQGGYPSRILVEKGKRMTSIPTSKITHLKADKDYTWIHMLNGESYLSTNGIGQLERKLNPRRFIRIHRSYIINIDNVQELYRDINKLFVALPNNIEINVGRNYLPVIKELMF